MAAVPIAPAPASAPGSEPGDATDRSTGSTSSKGLNKVAALMDKKRGLDKKARLGLHCSASSGPNPYPHLIYTQRMAKKLPWHQLWRGGEPPGARKGARRGAQKGLDHQESAGLTLPEGRGQGHQQGAQRARQGRRRCTPL